MTIAKIPKIVAPDENVSRYILQSNHIRRSDNTITPNAFMPHPYADLSVTRKLGLDEKEIWSYGEGVARHNSKTLYGRADSEASSYLEQDLQVISDPVLPPNFPENPNHAIVTGWPSDKPSQKMVALEIAAKAKYIPAPE